MITKLNKSSSGSKLNLTLSFDDLSTLANFGDSDEANMKYKKLTDDNANFLALVSHYPDYEKSELKNGGYATVTYVITSGGSKEKVSIDKKTDETQFSGENAGIKISNADSVYLLTVSDRTYDMGKIDDFEKQNDFKLVDDCIAKLESVAEKYVGNNNFDYDKALNNHLKIYQPQFDSVTLSLGDDSFDSNETLLKAQKGKKEIPLLPSVHIMPEDMHIFAVRAILQADFTVCGQVNLTPDGAVNIQWTQMLICKHLQ